MDPGDLQTALARNGEVRFVVRAKPGARLTAWLPSGADGVLRVAIRGAPERGKANAALQRFLAEYFSVPLECITFVAGLTAAKKTICITARR